MIGVAYNKRVLKLNKSEFFKKLLWQMLIFALFYISAKANFFGTFFSPFGIAIFNAIVWTKMFNPYVVCCNFMLANSLAGFNLNCLYVTLIAVFVTLSFVIIYKKLNKDVNIPSLLVATIIPEILFVYLNSNTPKQLATMIVFCVLSLIFLYCCLCFFKGTIIRGFSNKLNLDEQICGGIIVVILGMGLTSLNFYSVEPIKFVVALCVLISLKCFSKSTTIVLAGLFGVGYAFMFTNPSYIASFVLYAIMAIAFNSNIKIFSAVSILLTEIIFGFYFKTYTFFEWQSILSVGLAGVIYVCLPKRFFEYVNGLLGGYKNKVAVRSIVNRSKEQLCLKMDYLADIFADMNNVFRSTIKGQLSEKDAKQMIVDECVNKVCSKCSEKNKCLKLNRNLTFQTFADLVDIGFDRGRITLLDLPQFLSSKCSKVNFLISTLNQLFNSYKNYSNMISNMDSSKTLIADQLGGVSNVLKSLINEIDKNITFDLESENRILEDLTYKNVNCQEVVVYEQGVYDKNVTLIIQNQSFDEKIIEKCVSKVCGLKMKITKVKPAQISNMSEVILNVKPKFDIVFGSATRCKDGRRINGDSHSLINVGNGKYIMAICDGMGNGISAHKSSNQTINLIEDFYKVGFDNQTILNSVNRLLTLSQEETYSTLDLCLFDLNQQSCDFIKLGSPDCYIKRKLETEVVSGSSLPIGILEELQPKIESRVFHGFDMFVFVSDGISDTFDKFNNLKVFINDESTINPQILAERILEKTIELNGGECSDDLTVVCVRVFPS